MYLLSFAKHAVLTKSLAWRGDDPISRTAEQSVLNKDGGTRTFQVLVGQPMWDPVGKSGGFAV